MRTRTIRITQIVWDAIAAQGKFGETENDVLKRILGINENHNSETSGRKRYATNKMSSKVDHGILYIKFDSGASNKWKLPSAESKGELRSIFCQAKQFANENGATYGQQQAIRNTLNVAGYLLTK